MLEHGGRLRDAAARYTIPLADWLDLSTGINPHAWPVPALPNDVWQRLPEEGDGLEAAAADYYGTSRLLPVAGSQAALQWLPALLPRAAVACIAPLYAEHPHAWQRAGHKIRYLQNAPLARALAAATPYVLLCNPNNPTASAHTREQILEAAQQLGQRGGWLIVDEAFIDATPAQSVASEAGSEAFPRLVVLRSLGKFFGLAGARIGFLCAADSLREQMAEAMGPWTLSGPAREVARRALGDLDWQAGMRQTLATDSERLRTLLAPLGPTHASALFATLTTPHAVALHEHLARRGILTRLFDTHGLLRFGLPGQAAGWAKLTEALLAWSPPA